MLAFNEIQSLHRLKGIIIRKWKTRLQIRMFLSKYQRPTSVIFPENIEQMSPINIIGKVFVFCPNNVPKNISLLINLSKSSSQISNENKERTHKSSKKSSQDEKGN